MVRLATLKPRIAVDRTQRVQPVKVADTRITGWKLQSRRKRLWLANPCCAMCGRLTEYPYGFELITRWHSIRAALIPMRTAKSSAVVMMAATGRRPTQTCRGNDMSKSCKCDGCERKRKGWPGYQPCASTP